MADLDSRAGSQPLNADYGNPYDPKEPPWPTYRDPTRAKLEKQAVDEAAQRRAFRQAPGEEYIFDGPRDPARGDRAIKTDIGTFKIGDTIKLTDAQLASFTQMGFGFTLKIKKRK